MDFVRRYFFTNATLTSCPLFFSSKLDFPVIKRLERDFFTLSECISNVLITEKSNFDEKSGQLVRVAFIKKLLLTELGL